jgi:hypothetical protein
MFQGLLSIILLAAAIYLIYSIYRWIKIRNASFAVDDEIDTAEGLKRAQKRRDDNASTLADAPEPVKPEKVKKASTKKKAAPKAKTTKKKKD